MAVQLPPIPNNPITDIFVWRDWFYKVSQLLVQQASIAWTSIDFTGSNLRDIITRQHNALQDMQGGLPNQYYHLSAAQYAAVSSLPNLPYAYGAFHQDGTTTLTSGITNVSTTPIPVVSTSAFPSAGYLLIDTELIQYTGTTSTTFTGITRGVLGSTAAAHSSGAYVTEVQGTGSPTTIGVLKLNNTDYSSNVAINPSDITQIVCSRAGLYNIQFSAQLLSYANASDNVTIWIRQNGVDVASTAGVQLSLIHI